MIYLLGPTWNVQSLRQKIVAKGKVNRATLAVGLQHVDVGDVFGAKRGIAKFAEFRKAWLGEDPNDVCCDVPEWVSRDGEDAELGSDVARDAFERWHPITREMSECLDPEAFEPLAP